MHFLNGWAGAEVGFCGDRDQRPSAEVGEDGRFLFRERASGDEEKDNYVGFFEKPVCAALGFFGENIVVTVEAGCVDELEDGVHGAEGFGYVVARGAGLVGGDDALVAEKRIEEGGLADVGFSGQYDHGRGEELFCKLPTGEELLEAAAGRAGFAGSEELGDMGEFA